MTIYAIGDVQGCYSELRYLLDQINFNPEEDVLWFTGDLINRGRESLAVLRFVRKLGDRAVSVMGNHEIYLLAIVYGGYKTESNDTIKEILKSDQCDELCDWIRRFPLIYRHKKHVLVHAGIPHIWSLSAAMDFAKEVQTVLQGNKYRKFLKNVFQYTAHKWCDNLQGGERLATITNFLTRMRLIDATGRLNFSHKGSLGAAPKGFGAWFDYPTQIKQNLIFGHWASLDGGTFHSKFYAIDTGCVWGRQLTALRLPDHTRIAVDSGSSTQSKSG